MSGPFSFSVLTVVTRAAKSLHHVVTFQLVPYCPPGRKSPGVADVLGVAVLLHQPEQLSVNVYIFFFFHLGCSKSGFEEP